MKRLAIPLASYIAVTVVVPILNGAPTDAAFLEHTLLVLTLTGTLSLFVTSRIHALPAARIAVPSHLSSCDLSLRNGVKSGTCLPGECPLAPPAPECQ